MACLVRVLIGGELRTRDIKEGEILMGGVTLVTKSVTIGRNENESSGSAALGFVGDDDYDGALLVNGGVVHSKGWVIDSNCSFHICCEKEKFTKLSYYDNALLLYQMIKR